MNNIFCYIQKSFMLYGFVFLSLCRTDISFQNHLKKGILLNPTDYILPVEICAMVNVVIDAKNQSFKLCSVDGSDAVSSEVQEVTKRIVLCIKPSKLQKRCIQNYLLRLNKKPKRKR